MARAGAAAVVLFAVICCLLVATAPARRPVELPQVVLPDAVDREAAVEPLLPKPVVDAVQEAEVGPARQRPQLSSLLCLVYRCDGVGDAVVVSSSDEPSSLDGWAQPAGKGGVERPYDSGPDSDSDCDSDSDDDGDDWIVGWFWRLAHRF